MKSATTNYISEQKLYPLPISVFPKINVEVYNRHTKKWRYPEYRIVLEILDKKKKTDETIKINYN